MQRTIAEYLSLKRLYITLYRQWSAVTHGGDSSRFIETLPNGTIWGHQLRLADNLSRYAYLGGFFLWSATDSMLIKFRPFEPSHAKWSEAMRTRLSELSEIEVEVIQGPRHSK